MAKTCDAQMLAPSMMALTNSQFIFAEDRALCIRERNSMARKLPIAQKRTARTRKARWVSKAIARGMRFSIRVTPPSYALILTAKLNRTVEVDL
jgi:hypothetical protein